MIGKRLIVLLLSALLALSSTPVRFHHVRAVYDGDTILLDTGEKVRYLGMDAPEMNHGTGEPPEFMAPEAHEMNQALVRGKRVRLELDEEVEDRYERRLAYVYLESGEMVNALLVRKGLAFVLFKRPNVKHFSHLLQQQRRAMQEKCGLWSREVSHPEKFYTGNTGSYIFHRPQCVREREISRGHRTRFESRRSAFWEGFHPCRVCKP